MEPLNKKTHEWSFLSRKWEAIVKNNRNPIHNASYFETKDRSLCLQEKKQGFLSEKLLITPVSK